MTILTLDTPQLQVQQPGRSDHSGFIHKHRMPFGAELEGGGQVRFRLWGPGANTVAVEIDGLKQALPLARNPDGWHEAVTHQAHAGSRYRFVLPDGTKVPDPASRFQPSDVHGPSEVIDPGAYVWGDMAWRGMRWSKAVIYEMHIGTFTRAGTFCAAIEKLD